MNKPKLSIDQQIDHLEEKGIKFEICTKEEAKNYLSRNNYYFKLASYRKNYEKHIYGKNIGKYINLDFAYLQDLAIIDMRLRYLLVQMAMDIEHYIKVDLLHRIENSDEDGYKICQDFFASLDEDQNCKIKEEISRNSDSNYCKDIVNKYEIENMPVWVMLEIISFGRLITFYKYCSERFNDKRMSKLYYMLISCKSVRNAAAHSSCILNEIHANTAKHQASYLVTKELGYINGISRDTITKKMSNERIQEIVTLLFVHREIVTSQGVHIKASKSLQDFTERINRNINYYNKNLTIKSTFEFLSKIIDNWFKNVVN